jgi:hypothetical protein
MYYVYLLPPGNPEILTCYLTSVSIARFLFLFFILHQLAAVLSEHGLFLCYGVRCTQFLYSRFLSIELRAVLVRGRES